MTREQVLDVERLRRSTSDRYVAGVAGGLARHLDVDPVVVRVLLAVLTLVGGAGVLVYAAVWIFVPDDRATRAPIELGPDARRVVLAVVGVLALLVALGSPFLDGRGSSVVPVLLLLVAGAVAWTTRRRERRTPAPPAPWAGPTSSAPPAPHGGGSTTQTMPVTPVGGVGGAGGAGGVGGTGGPGQEPPRWTTPPAYRPAPPPRPQRTGLVLFWPTLALVAIALGTLGIVDASSTVPVSAYAALALAVTGLALLVGAFVGRPGGLIALGLLLSLALLVTSAVDAATGGSTRDEDVRAAPTSATQVRDAYSVRTGSLTLDLSGVRDVAALDGRDLTVTGRAAELLVVLPPGVDAEVSARVRYAGQVDLEDFSRGGFDFSTTRTLPATTGATGTTGTADAPTVRLDLATRVGRITVTHG